MQSWKLHSAYPHVFKFGDNLAASRKEGVWCTANGHSIKPESVSRWPSVTGTRSYRSHQPLNFLCFILKIGIISTLLILQILFLRLEWDDGSKSYYYSIFLLFTKKSSTPSYVKNWNFYSKVSIHAKKCLLYNANWHFGDLKWHVFINL